MDERASSLLTSSSSEPNEDAPAAIGGWRMHVSPRVAGKLASTQARAKALTLDPRDAYRLLSDPSNPVHENMPMLLPDPRTPLGAPFVEETVGHPTPKELQRGLCSACCGACGLMLALGMLLVIVVVDPWAIACSQGSANAQIAVIPQECRHLPKAGDIVDARLPRTKAECNTCSDAFDGVCDEGDAPTVENPAGIGACAIGTDGFDCTVDEISRESAVDASDALTTVRGTDGKSYLIQFTSICNLLIMGGALVVLPLLLGTGKLVSTLPMISDMLHEMVRSRGLAIVESAVFFLLALSIYNDTRLCHSSFTVRPQVHDFTVPKWDSMWPTDLPKTVASFRVEDAKERFAMFTAFAARFFLCNVANNHWQAAGKNLTGLAYILGVISSWWSFIIVASDAQYCRYPTEAGTEVVAGYCTIYGTGLSADGVSSQRFLSDCELMRSSGWNDTQIAFYQQYNTLPPDTKLTDRPSEVSIVPSRAHAFADAARHWAMIEETSTNFSAPLFPEDGFPPANFFASFIDLSDDGSSVCPAAAGSILEAIHLYATDCEDNSRMRESMLLVSGLAALNLVEGVFMTVIALSVISEGTLIKDTHLDKLPQTLAEKNAQRLQQLYSARAAVGSTDANWISRLLVSHAETQDGTTFNFPVRLLASVLVSAILMLMMLSSVDFIAVQLSREIDNFENFYHSEVVPLLRTGHSNLTVSSYFDELGVLLSYHSTYFVENPGLPPRHYLPGFHTLDSDCPCSIIHAAADLSSELAEHVAAVADAASTQSVKPAGRGGRLHRLGNLCPQNAHETEWSDCACNDGFAFDGKFCVQDAISHHAEALAEILQRNSTGALIKCSVQTLRQLYEPLPFAIRYAGAVAFAVGGLSIASFMLAFRRKAKRLQALVEEHFDPAKGWPKDPTVLHEEDVRLLTGGKRSWQLDYVYLEKLPSFIGLYCGNCVCAFGVHFVVWMVVLYFITCTWTPSGTIRSTFVLLMPVLLETVLKKVIWGKIVDRKHGVRHPRLYAYVDVLLSLTSTVTGPIKTFLRVAGAIVCLFVHLFRSDVTMMLDRSFLPLDPHFTACTGLLTGLRVQYEFNKIRRHKPPSVTTDTDMNENSNAGVTAAGDFPMEDMASSRTPAKELSRAAHETDATFSAT